MGAAREKRKQIKRLLGRSSDCGRVCFKTGVILNRRDKLRNRNSKIYRRNLRRELSGE